MLINIQSSSYDGVGDIMAQSIASGEMIVRVDTAPSSSSTEVTDVPS